MKTINKLNGEFNEKDSIMKAIYYLAFIVLLGFFINTLVKDVFYRENNTNIETVNAAAVEEIVNEGTLFKMEKGKDYKYEYDGNQLVKASFMTSHRNVEFNVTERKGTLEEINNDYEKIKHTMSNHEYALTLGEKALVIPLIFCIYGLMFSLLVLFEPTIINVIEFVKSHRNVKAI